MTTIYDDCSKEELLQIVSEMQKDLNDSKKEIERLHKVFDIKDDARCELVKENKELQRIINDLQSDLVGATNDYKQAVNEVKLLNRQLDRQNTAVNDLTDIVETSHKIIDCLKEENKELKFRLKNDNGFLVVKGSWIVL